MKVYFLNQYRWRNESYVQSAEVEKETDCFYWTKSDTNYKRRPDRREKSECFLTKQDAINKLLEKYRLSVSCAQDRLKEAESKLSEVEEWARQNDAESPVTANNIPMPGEVPQICEAQTSA